MTFIGVEPQDTGIDPGIHKGTRAQILLLLRMLAAHFYQMFVERAMVEFIPTQTDRIKAKRLRSPGGDDGILTSVPGAMNMFAFPKNVQCLL